MDHLPPSSLERVNRLTPGRDAVRVKSVFIERITMMPDTVRARFENGKEFYEDGHGIAVRISDKEWLYLEEGGPR